MRKRKFGRQKNARRALLKRLAEEVFLRERLQTTVARAKTVRPIVEHAISHARLTELASLRLLRRRFGKTTVEKLVGVLGPRYREQHGGYTRITRLSAPRRDGAEEAVIELVK